MGQRERPKLRWETGRTPFASGTSDARLTQTGPLTPASVNPATRLSAAARKNTAGSAAATATAAITTSCPAAGSVTSTRTLRILERDGFVSGAAAGRAVSYELTPLGRSLLGPLTVVYEWTADHWDELLDARDPVEV